MCLLTKKMAVLSSTFWGWSSIGRSSRRRFLPPRFAGFDVHVHRREWQGLRLNTRMTLKIFFRSNEMFAHRKSVDEFNSTSCRIVPLRNHLEHVRLWSTIFDYHVYIYIFIYDLYILYQSYAHDDYTPTNPCPFQSMEKPLPSIFGNAHSLHVFLPMFIQQGLVGYQGGLWQWAAPPLRRQSLWLI